MSNIRKCKVLVVGAGPGGYVAAIRSAQLGMDTVIVEGQRAGGTCLIRGCIPSKAMIHAAHRLHNICDHMDEGGHMGISVTAPPVLNMQGLVEWKEKIVTKLNKGVEHLIKANGAELITGWATFVDAKTVSVKTADGEMRIEAEHVIMALGSVPTELPFMPFENNVISSKGALELQNVPEHLVVVGGGYIGLELGITYKLLGSEVTILEAMDSVVPIFDKEVRRPVELYLKKNKVKVHTGVFAKGVEDIKGGKTKVFFTPKDADKDEPPQEIIADKVLVTVGRRPNVKRCGIEATGVSLDEMGFVKVDERCATNMRNVWAIGDVSNMGPMLAHDASFQGELVAEIIAGKKRIYDPVAVPAIVFTEPEIVSVGLSPDEAKEAGHPIITGKFPLGANGRALTQEAEKTAGFIRVVAREDTHQILGIQCVGTHVSELSGEFTLALEMGAVLEDIAGTIHAHPTMSEIFHEGVLATLGHAIHTTN